MSAIADDLCRRHRYTVVDYDRMIDAGILTEDDRVELIEGEIIDIPPIGSAHGGAVKRIGNKLARLIADSAIIAIQDPIRVNDRSEPQPDIALLKPRDDFYASAHPRAQDVLLIVEVAETSLRYDRDVKLPLYAQAGIPEAWLVDIANRTLWVCRSPGAKGYTEVAAATDLSALRPLLMPRCLLDLSGLF